MRISPEQILPSQNFLKPRTIAYILDCINTERFENLPPDPIVRKDDQDNIIAIDGHNLIAVKLRRGEDINVHIASSPDDGLVADSVANIKRNKDLQEKFDSVIDDNKRLREEGINTFSDLVDRYSKLF